MIRAEIRPGRIELRGHAGYGRKGQDIVCAAVSMLVYVQLRLGAAAAPVMEPGHVVMEGAALEVLELGLRMLAQEYPRQVQLT